MAAREQLETWRAELVEEQAALLEELATAKGKLTTAQREYQGAAADWAEIRDLTNHGIHPFDGGMASGLHARLEERRREALRGPSGARAIAMGRVKSIQGAIAGRALAICQIDRALSAEKVTPLRPVDSYRKPVPLDYENITMSPGAQINAR